MIVFRSEISSSRFLSAAASRSTSSSLVGAFTCAGPLRSAGTSFGAGFSFKALAALTLKDSNKTTSAPRRREGAKVVGRQGHAPATGGVGLLVQPFATSRLRGAL